MAAPQQSIGPFRIMSKLGAGGMGEVWRATDSRLQRDVAIKVLPAAFASDPMRMARFTREAQVLASLNHPGIATIHGVEQNALVMELVEGPTLAERIARGSIALDEALPFAIQIAEALEYAHERGVVHRDLKPANIKLTPEGRVKILDFGLAKAVSVDSESSALPEATTLNSPATMVGAILGTAAYMSPEQARGKSVDRRADIWAFGVVLYEMLVGTRPFVGEDLTETLAAVVKTEPTFDGLLEPARGVIQRCLQKDPRQRLSWIGEARYGLQNPPPPPAIAVRRRREWVWVAALVVAAGLAWWLRPMPVPDRTVGRFSYQIPGGQAFTRPGRHVLAISPDGSKIVYIAGRQLYLRALNSLEAQVIPGAANDPYEPLFSPDGQWIAYFTPSTPSVLQKIPITGGAPITLCTLKGAVYGASWSDGHIVFVDGNGATFAIESAPDTGGAPQVVDTVGGGATAFQPELIDHGRGLLFTFMPQGYGYDATSEIVAENVGAPASRRTVLTGGGDVHLLSGGSLIYIHDSTIFGVPYSTSRRSVTGTPVPLVTGVTEYQGRTGQYALASNGTLVYWPGSSHLDNPPRRLAWLDQRGGETPVAAPPRVYQYPRISPDGKLIAVNTQDQPADLWIWDTTRNALSRLSFGAAAASNANTIYAAWTSDGQSVYYSDASGLYRKAADGTGPTAAVSIFHGPSFAYLEALSPDGHYAITRQGAPAGLQLLSLKPPGDANPLLSDPRFNQLNADISPDGRWLAYQSNETGSYEIYVRPFPNVQAGRWQVSSGPAQFPVWSRDGHKLYYVATTAPAQMMAVVVQSQPAFSAGPPKALFPYQELNLRNAGREFDVAPDGRFLVLRNATPPSTPQAQSLTIVTNWASEVAAKMH